LFLCFSLSLTFSLSPGVSTQALHFALAGQALYHLSHTSSPNFFNNCCFFLSHVPYIISYELIHFIQVFKLLA
jgi:hypothetical protein